MADIQDIHLDVAVVERRKRPVVVLDMAGVVGEDMRPVVAEEDSRLDVADHSSLAHHLAEAGSLGDLAGEGSPDSRPEAAVVEHTLVEDILEEEDSQAVV